MNYLFLVLAMAAILCLEWVLDNIIWIGSIIILLLVISIVRAVPDYKEFGFDFNDFMILLFKLAAIAGIAWFMFWV